MESVLSTESNTGAYAPTKDKVRANTPFSINQRIDQGTMKRIWFYATQPKQAITRRIQEVDREWDVERMLAMKMSGAGLLGLIASALGRKRWLALSGLSMACLFHHAVWRSSPLVVLMRRIGVRTRREIDAEKYALRILRGDFDSLKNISEETHRAIEALRLSRL